MTPDDRTPGDTPPDDVTSHDPTSSDAGTSGSTTPGGTNPGDAAPAVPTSDETAATEDRLRATLHRVAASATPTDGLDRLRAATRAPAGAPMGDRPTPTEPVVLDLPTPRTATSGRLRGWLTAAAVLAAVAGIGALLTTVDLGGRTTHHTASSGGVLADASVTGWYVPVGLPDPWDLVEVRRQPLSIRPEFNAVVTFRSPTGRKATLTLGPTIPGPVEDDPAALDEPGSRSYVAGWFTEPMIGAVEGYGSCASLVGHWPGARLLVHITCPRAGEDTTSATAGDTDTTETTGGDTVQTTAPVDGAGTDDVLAARSEVSELIGALRPATAEEWAAFVRGADAYDDEVIVATVEDLRTPGVDGPTPSEPDATTTSEPVPNDPEQPGPGTDPNASRTVVEDAWAFPEQFDPLEGLTFTLIVDQPTVASGHAIGARLQITNTTTAHRTIHECSAIQTGIAFVPASDPGGEVPVPQIIDCYRTPSLEIPPGDTVDLPFAVNGFPAPLSARRHGVHEGMTVPLGALPPGEYLATAVMPGSDRAVRVQTPVTITEATCDGLTDELARAVIWRTEAEATAAAEALGFTLRPVIIDSVGQAVTDDLRCDRVNVAVGSGRVIDITSLG